MGKTFEDFVNELRAEAEKDGPEAVEELERYRAHFAEQAQKAQERRKLIKTVVALAEKWRAEGEFWTGTPEDSRSQSCADDLLKAFGLTDKDRLKMPREEYFALMGPTFEVEDRGEEWAAECAFREGLMRQWTTDLMEAKFEGKEHDDRPLDVRIDEKLHWAFAEGFDKGHKSLSETLRVYVKKDLVKEVESLRETNEALATTTVEMNKKISTLNNDLTEAIRRRSNLLYECEKLETELMQARQTMRMLSTSTEGVWRWQGDGDHPESLTCPVVMSPEKLRELLEARDTAKASEQQLADDVGELVEANKTMCQRVMKVEAERDEALKEAEQMKKERDEEQEMRFKLQTELDKTLGPKKP